MNKVVLEFDLDKLPRYSNVNMELWCDAVFGALAEGDYAALPDGVRLCDMAPDFINPLVYCMACRCVHDRSDCKNRNVIQSEQPHCTCHERDGSYVCNHCFSLGRRGHCQK